MISGVSTKLDLLDGKFIDLQEAAGPDLVNQDYYNAATKDWYLHPNL